MQLFILQRESNPHRLRLSQASTTEPPTSYMRINNVLKKKKKIVLVVTSKSRSVSLWNPDDA